MAVDPECVFASHSLPSESSTTAHVSNIQSWATALHSHHRPLLVHLNADTTWLVQLPYPASVKPPPGRTHFNVLLDPWLSGPQSDVASWFSKQWHAVASSVGSVEVLNTALREVEGRGVVGPRHCGSLVDLVIISHEFTDHCHRATMLELPQTTPVFATEVAAELARSWRYFDRVFTLPVLTKGVHWSRLASIGSLPGWIGIGRLESAGNVLYYHSAVLLSFDINYRADTVPHRAGEAIIYSPHGIDSLDLSHVSSSGVQTLALLHGLQDVRIWATKQLNLGALNGVRAMRVSRAKYWIATHDEDKKAGGLIAPFLMRTKYSFEDAVAHERLRTRDKAETGEYNYLELGCGDASILV